MSRTVSAPLAGEACALRNKLDTQSIGQLVRRCTVRLAVERRVPTLGLPEPEPDHECYWREPYRRIDAGLARIVVNTSAAIVERPALFEMLQPAAGVFANGPTYKHVRAMLGDADAALRLMAAGDCMQFWTLMTPAFLFGLNPESDLFAKLCVDGFVQCSPTVVFRANYPRPFDGTRRG